MIAYIIGEYKGLTENKVILDVNGFGMELIVSSFTLSKLPPKNEIFKLYTYLQITDSTYLLYGFAELKEKHMFLDLINVTGIGPKVGINILSSVDVNQLKYYIITENSKMLSKIKGIGKKTSERMIIELRDLYKDFLFEENVLTDSKQRVELDALSALQNLGFSHQDAFSALQGINTEELTLEEIITMALKSLAK